VAGLRYPVSKTGGSAVERLTWRQRCFLRNRIPWISAQKPREKQK